MLTKVLALVLVVLIGLALGIETARYVHAHATGVDVSGAVNIHHALGFSLLATSGALLLSLSREWLSRQWTRFTVWFELTLDGLFDFDALLPGEMGMALHRPVRHRKDDGLLPCRGCSQCGETPAISLMNCGPRMMKLPPRSPPPNRESKRPDDSYIQGDVLFAPRTAAKHKEKRTCLQPTDLAFFLMAPKKKTDLSVFTGRFTVRVKPARHASLPWVS